MTLESELNTPPTWWYGGIAFPGEGIRMITIGSRAFCALHWDLHDQMLAWGQSQLLPGQTEFRLPSMAQIHKDAAIFVKEVTGFTPEALMDYKNKLEQIYAGQSMGPFPFAIEWIEK